MHRDVKPANMLLEESVDRLLISDFGLARTVDDATLTRTGIVAGTPHYMSPEQAEGEVVGPASDLFSLGSVIYFMCTGHPPFRAASPMAVLNRICHATQRPVDGVNADIPLELVEVIEQLLSKSPEQRFLSAKAVASRLDELLLELQRGGQLRRRNWKRRWLRAIHHWRGRLVLAGAGVACVLLGGGVSRWFVGNGVMNQDSPPAPPAVSTGAEHFKTQAVSTNPPVPLEPDTFHKDLTEAREILGRIESFDTPVSNHPNDSEWDAEVSDLKARLNVP